MLVERNKYEANEAVTRHSIIKWFGIHTFALFQYLLRVACYAQTSRHFSPTQGTLQEIKIYGDAKVTAALCKKIKADTVSTRRRRDTHQCTHTRENVAQSSRSITIYRLRVSVQRSVKLFHHIFIRNCR